MVESLIFSSYFTSKKCPQRKRKLFQSDSYGLIKGWYESIVKLDLKGIIFHDSLSGEFVREYENRNVSFEKWELGARSTNDERFICYRDFIFAHEGIDNFFFTDLFDVIFYKNPFDLLSDDYDIYVGSEHRYNTKWMWNAYTRAYGQFYYRDKKLLNAGIIGGTRKNICLLLDKMVEDFISIRPHVNANMAALNKNTYDLFDEERICTGFPLHSRFKGNQRKGNFYIKHK